MLENLWYTLYELKMKEIYPEIANLSISQAAELMGVSISTIRRWIKYDKFPCYDLPGGFRFSVVEIEKWQRQRRHVQAEESEFMSAERVLKIAKGVR